MIELSFNLSPIILLVTIFVELIDSSLIFSNVILWLAIFSLVIDKLLIFSVVIDKLLILSVVIWSFFIIFVLITLLLIVNLPLLSIVASPLIDTLWNKLPSDINIFPSFNNPNSFIKSIFDALILFAPIFINPSLLTVTSPVIGLLLKLTPSEINILPSTIGNSLFKNCKCLFSIVLSFNLLPFIDFSFITFPSIFTTSTTPFLSNLISPDNLWLLYLSVLPIKIIPLLVEMLLSIKLILLGITAFDSILVEIMALSFIFEVVTILLAILIALILVNSEPSPINLSADILPVVIKFSSSKDIWPLVSVIDPESKIKLLDPTFNLFFIVVLPDFSTINLPSNDNPFSSITIPLLALDIFVTFKSPISSFWILPSPPILDGAICLSFSIKFAFDKSITLFSFEIIIFTLSIVPPFILFALIESSGIIKFVVFKVVVFKFVVFKFVVSIFVESKLLIEIVFISPPSILSPLIWLSFNFNSASVTSKIFVSSNISEAFVIIPPSILSPLIWLSFNFNSASVTSKILLLFIIMLAFVIVPPSILSPLTWLSANNSSPLLTSNWFVSKFIIFKFSMVPPSILSPLIWLSAKIKFPLLISNFLDEFISTFNSPSIILFADILLILSDVIWFSASIRLALDTSKYLFLLIDDVKSISESNIEPFFHNPLFTNNDSIPTESIVPPFILFPLIESSAKFKNPLVKSKIPPWLKVILFEFKFSILIFSIVPPSILSPLIWLSEINIFASLTSNIFPSETLKLVKIKLLISTLSIVPPLILFALICLSLNNTVDSDKSIILSLVVLILAFSIEILLIVPPLIFSPEIELSGKITLPKVVSIILPTPRYISDSWITPLFHTPVITSNCVILISLIVPPSILLPEICLSFNIKLASLRSTILSIPASIATLVILPPWILSPLIWLLDNNKSPSVISKKYLPPDKFSPIVISELLIKPLFHIPDLTSKSLIVILLIIPLVILLGFNESILSPLIWLSAKINSPSDTSNIPNETSIFLFIPTSILASVIVPPSILSPLIWLSANNMLPFVISKVLFEFIVISDSEILLSNILLVSILIPEKVPPKIASALIELLGNKISPWISKVFPELIVISVLIILPLFIKA